MYAKSRASGPRVAIVGAGLMGRWHARCAARNGARVVAIVDRDLGRARALARAYPGACPLASLGDCLPNGVEIVHVCTPVATHAAIATQALAARRHVLVEKPLATSFAETARLVELARGQGARLNPVHQFPFQPAVTRLRDRLARLGTLVRVEYATATAAGAGQSGAARRALLREIAPHPLSLFRAVLGEELARGDWGIFRSTADELEFGGTLGAIPVHALLDLRARPTRNQLTVSGTRGTAYVDLFHGYLLIETGAPTRRTKLLRPFVYAAKLLAVAGGNLAWRATRGEYAYPGLTQLIGRFYAAVARDTPAPIGADEILDIARLLDGLAAGASARERGRW